MNASVNEVAVIDSVVEVVESGLAAAPETVEGKNKDISVRRFVLGPCVFALCRKEEETAFTIHWNGDRVTLAYCKEKGIQLFNWIKEQVLKLWAFLQEKGSQFIAWFNNWYKEWSGKKKLEAVTQELAAAQA